jgi:cation diffusion facilitator family transporter
MNSVLTRAERTRQTGVVLWVILALNWAVALLKLSLGFVTSSMTIFADGLHSFSDGASNIIGLVAVSIASRGPDHTHPYGRQKYETLASTGISVLLFMVAIRIYKEGILGVLHEKKPEVSGVSFILMAGTLLVNFFVVWYEKKKARELESEILNNDAWHTMTDIFVTLSVLLALVGIRLNIPKLDAIFTLIIATVIMVTAFRILKRSADVLTDRAVIDCSLIEKIVRSVGGVSDCHEIRTRGKIDDMYLDLHVLVDNQMTVLASHHVANVIEKKIKHEIPGVHDVVVHIEPVSHGHEELEI